MDPSSFHEKDLDDDLGQFIVSWATENPLHNPIRLVVQCSVVFGVLLMLMPGPGALVLVLWIGAYALVFGLLLMVLAFKVRRLGKKSPLWRRHTPNRKLMSVREAGHRARCPSHITAHTNRKSRPRTN
jgi:Short repeat of unknown function (DUF308)